jgi:signal transduction histidine kinase
LNNAIEAVNEQGRITVESRTSQMGGQEFVAVSITDNGPGMAVRRIVDLPRSSEGATSNKGKGFGLFLTREIVTSHGGHMEVQSSAGAGTAILLYFPVSAVE